jgi:hypothetical protein
LFGTQRDGEGAARVVSSTRPRQAGDEVVEGGAELVGEVAEDGAPSPLRLTLNVDDVLACVDFEATEDSACCLVKEGAPFTVERIQVFVCPLQPEPGVLAGNVR